MVRLELELFESATKDDIYELRNFLKEEIPEAEFTIKEQPALPGQMSPNLVDGIVGGVLHATAAILLESLYHSLLKPLLQKWLEKKQTSNSRLEIMSTISNEEEKLNILMDVKGKTEYFNFKYAIDTSKTYALLIGVGKFKSYFHPIPPVKGNIEDLFKLLISKKHVGIPSENVIVSYDDSHLEIQKKLLQISSIKDAQTVIIYFAGHGYRSDIKKLSLITADTEKIGDEIIGGIDFDFIKNKVLKNSIAKQKIVILDACHSGIATQGDDDLVNTFDVKGSYILTSSPGDEVSYFEKSAQNTYFTSALLNVLKNGIDNTNEMLALEDLYGYTKDILFENNMPIPNSKNELNIPSSQFFIARNPSFSTEKLKLRASNLFRDGKLDEALDEYRSLLKRFPNDENLRRLFEECETEKSFSNLVHEANSLFYKSKDYAKAVDLYRKAYQIKKDAMLMEKIRQCESYSGISFGDTEALMKIKENENYIAFKRAYEREAFYSALQYLKKLKQIFPDSKYVKDELALLETKLADIADSRKDKQLDDYYKYFNKGDFIKADVELKNLIQNDPEYPVFHRLQKTLQLKLKKKEEKLEEEKKTTLFRFFLLLPLWLKVVSLLIPAAIIAGFITVYLNKHNSTDSGANSGKKAVVNKDITPVNPDSGKLSPTVSLTKDTNQMMRDKMQTKDLVLSRAQAIKKPDENASKLFLPERSTSVADILIGTTYEESITNNTISFLYAAKNKIHFEGLIADYPVSGEFVITANKFLKANSSNIEGDLTLSDNQLSLTGYLKIKGRDVTKKLNLIKK